MVDGGSPSPAYPMDGTFNQTSPLTRLVGAKHVFSVDLKLATDRSDLFSVLYEC